MNSRVLSLLLTLCVSSWNAAPALGEPVVFWVSEPAGPGDIVLLYGGGLAHVARASIKRFDDGDAGAPPGAAGNAHAAAALPPLQASDSSLQFAIPPSLPPRLC